MATTGAELALMEGRADYVVVSEGEITFCELLRAMEAKQGIEQVEGIVYRDGSGALCRTPDRPFANLAEFPVIDWSFIDPKKYFASNTCCDNMMHLYVSKGCPGRCAFCINEMFHRCRYRKRPNEYVMREIRELAEHHGMEGVTFADEFFGVNKKDLYDLCDRLRALNRNLVWGCMTRIGHLSREDLRYMYDSGMRWIFYGQESGSPEMLERIHKNTGVAVTERENRDCKEIGIQPLYGFIIGYPDETVEQLRDTVRMIQRLDADMHIVVFFPFPGTELYQYLVDNGRFTPFQSLKEWSRKSAAIMQGLVGNYSNVPTRDLLVIQSVLLWRRIFRRRAEKKASGLRVILDSIMMNLRHAWRGGLLHICAGIYSSLKTFLSLAWYTYAYPAVREKYGLSIKKGTEEHRA